MYSYSLELVSLYKEKKLQSENEYKFQQTIELYKDKLNEIESLKKDQNEFILNKYKGQKYAEKQIKIREEHIITMEQKALDFKEFMRERGKEALEYVK